MPEFDDERHFQFIDCEQCADRYAVMAPSLEVARRTAPLRTCAGCSRLSCLACWPIGAKRCIACRRYQEIRGNVGIGLGHEPPTQIQASESAEPSQHQGSWRSPTIVAAITAQTLAVLLVVAVGGGLLSPAASTGNIPPPQPTLVVSEAPDSAAGRGAALPGVSTNIEDPLPPPAGDGAAAMQITAEQLVVWTDAFGQVRLQVVATARNRSAGQRAIATSASTWAVIDEAGDEVARGRFTHAFPPVVPADGRVLLVEDLTTSFERSDELADLEVEVASEPVDQSSAVVPLEVADVSWSRSADAGLVVRARVSNVSGMDVSRATLGVVLRDAGNQILCGIYDVSVGEIEAGSSRSVVAAYPGTPPISPDLVASAEGAAAGEH